MSANIIYSLYVILILIIGSSKLKIKLMIQLIVIISLAGICNLSAGVIVLMNGKLTEKSTGKPIAAKIKFFDKSGKEHSSNSNSNDGAFQQVLPAGNEFTVVVVGWIVSPEKRKFVIQDYSEYTEFEKDFDLVEIKPGITLNTAKLFEKNSSGINSESDDFFKYLKLMSKNQNGVIFEAAINSADSYFETKTVKIQVTEKGKRKTKSIKTTTDEQLTQLLNQRKVEFLNKLTEFSIPEKSVNIRTELVINKPKPKAKVKSKKKSKKKSIQVIDTTPGIFPDDVTLKIDKVIKL